MSVLKRKNSAMNASIFWIYYLITLHRKKTARQIKKNREQYMMHEAGFGKMTRKGSFYQQVRSSVSSLKIGKSSKPSSRKNSTAISISIHSNNSGNQQTPVLSSASSSSSSSSGAAHNNGSNDKKDGENKEEEDYLRKHQPRGEYILKNIIMRVQNAQKFAQQFLDDDNRPKSLDQNVKWNTFDRPIRAKKLREYLKTEADAIRKHIDDLYLYYKINNMATKITVERFREDMTEDCYWFWINRIGADKMSSTWDIFIDAYQVLYGSLASPNMERYLKQLLCNKKDEVSVFRLIRAIRIHNDFPFSTDITSSLNDSCDPLNKNSESEEMSEVKRMKLTEMTMQLVRKFASPEIRAHLHNIYGWFDGIRKDDEHQVRMRGDQWGEKMKAVQLRTRQQQLQVINRKGKDVDKSSTTGDAVKEKLVIMTDEEAKQIEDIDLARRAIYFFYQEFMIMWRVGQLPRNTLKLVDFPGKGRIRDFISLVGALDHANYYIVMGKQENDPNREYTPQVYKFMAEYLKILECQASDKKEKEQQFQKQQNIAQDSSSTSSSNSSSSSSSSSGSGRGTPEIVRQVENTDTPTSNGSKENDSEKK